MSYVYKSPIHCVEDCHEGYNLPHFDELKLTFSDNQIDQLKVVHNLITNESNIRSVTVAFEPIVDLLLDDELLSDETVYNSDFNAAFYSCDVSVHRQGDVIVEWFCKYSNNKSWVNSFNLDKLT